MGQGSGWTLKVGRWTLKVLSYSDGHSQSPGLQILLDQVRLFAQELHVLVRGLEEQRQGAGRLLEGLAELLLFLVAPGALEVAKLAVDRADQPLELVVEAVQVGGESSQFVGVYVRLGHSRASGWSISPVQIG